MNPRLTIDELEILTPDELGKLLRDAVHKPSPDISYIQDLLYVGCPIDSRANDGRTALHLAARNWKVEIIEFLLSNEADIHSRDRFGHTALHKAASNGRAGMVKILISKGADIHARDNSGRRAWDVATWIIKASISELNPK